VNKLAALAGRVARRLRISRSRGRLAALAVAVGVVGPGPTIGPYDIPLYGSPTTPNAHGHGQLVYADSPFGVALTKDGHARYDIQVTAAALPAPSSLGKYTAYVAWAATPDLSGWTRLGTVSNGNSTVGPVDLNKFLLVVTAEADSASATHAGPTVLHGISPSSLLQRFLTKPAFRGVQE
jgi:hypothetical protein